MRAIAAVFVIVAFPLAPTVQGGGEKDLFDKFKRQNDQSRDKLVADIKVVLEKATALEKDEPAKALLLLQVVRDGMLAKGLLAAKEDRALAEPLWERIQTLQVLLRGKQADELRGAVGDYKEYLSRMREEFANLRQALVPPNKEVPPGWPAFIEFANGTQAVGWVHQAPFYIVNATVNDQERTYGPGIVAGLHTPQGFYLYHHAAKRFVHLPNAEFFLTAVATHLPSRRAGFWMPTDTPPPPPGFFRTSAGAVGAALFARSAGTLMATWAGPGKSFPEAATEGGADPTTRRLYRDVLVDLMVQEFFVGARKADQTRYRDAILAFLDRRGRDDALTAEEVSQFSDLIADINPDRRSDAVAFSLLLNRLLEQSARLRSK